MILSFEEKEKAFTDLLNQTAKDQGCFFIADAGEGHDFETETMYLEDVSGWLCKAGTPEQEQRADENYCFAEWEFVDDIPIIRFIKR